MGLNISNIGNIKFSPIRPKPSNSNVAGSFFEVVKNFKPKIANIAIDKPIETSNDFLKFCKAITQNMIETAANIIGVLALLVNQGIVANTMANE